MAELSWSCRIAESDQKLLEAQERIEAIEGIKRGLESMRRNAGKPVEKFFREFFAEISLKGQCMMKSVSNLASIGILVVLSACAAVSVSAVPQMKVGAHKEVKVYFYHDPGEYIDLAPVTRSVNASAPARLAIEALLKGPTAAERQRGFESLASASDFRIGSLKISGATARINFVSTRRWTGWAGDLAPVRFKTAVELTLKQFPSVQRVIVSLNGDEKFYDERG